MYAVIETGGKQFRVAIGDKLRVENLEADAGATIELEKVLMIADGKKVEVGAPLVDGAKVLATVVSHGRGPKIRVFKMRRRKNYRRSQGHRQGYTELEITGIGDVKAAPKKAVKAEPKGPAPAKEAKKGPASESLDDLTQISGVGPVLAKKLNDLGITNFDQIAALSQKEIERMDEELNFKGRIEREHWVEQAKELCKTRDQDKS